MNPTLSTVLVWPTLVFFCVIIIPKLNINGRFFKDPVGSGPVLPDLFLDPVDSTGSKKVGSGRVLLGT